MLKNKNEQLTGSGPIWSQFKTQKEETDSVMFGEKWQRGEC